MPDLVFVDTETTGLHPTLHRVWEFAGIKTTQEGGGEERVLLQVDVDVHMGDADPFALNIGKFWERYGKNGDWYGEEVTDHDGNVISYLAPRGGERCSAIEAAKIIREFTHGCMLIGNTISFDAERLGLLLRENFQTPTWHYHVIDIEPIIVGYLKGQWDFGVRNSHVFDPAILNLPYNTEDLSKAIGVEPPGEEDRHTAMGDAEWVLRQWNAIF